MPVRGINHFNIRSRDIAASARFYSDVLGLELRSGPIAGGGQRHWLHDAAGDPFIHFIAMEPPFASTGLIDHVALNCRGKADIVARLAALDIPYTLLENSVPGTWLIFVEDHDGVRLELNFADE